MSSIEICFSNKTPQAARAADLVRDIVLQLGLRHEIRTKFMEALDELVIRVEGRDIQSGAAQAIENDDSGVPPRWLIEAALLRQINPRHLLFLCANNSARSQMAEGLARRLAPVNVIVSSAGSTPTQVRPEAVLVLDELGIDISHHESKSVEQIESADVHAVITLCAEQVCPLFLGRALQVHWPLSDPAAVIGDEQTRLEAFRSVRDELLRRLTVLFD